MNPIHLNSTGLKTRWQPSRENTDGGSLIIVLHGRGDSTEGWTWLLPELNLPNLSALLVNAPDPWDIGYSWYGLPPNQGPGVKRSRELLLNALPEIHSQGYPPERCFLLGFSQGCLMTLDVGSRHPHRLAGYIGISGYCFEPDTLMTEASTDAITGDWLVTHGTEDPVLDVNQTRAQIQQLQKAGFRIDYREYEKTHTVDPERELPELREWIRTRMQRRPESPL